MSLAVLKFGGTSVGDARAMRQTAQIIKNAVAQFDNVVVVTSAMGKSPDPRDQIKVTDTLINSAKLAAEGDGEFFHKAKRQLADKHFAAIDSVVDNPEDRRVIGEQIEQLLDGFETLCSSVRVLGEVTPRALDAISGIGERMAARILGGALRSIGVKAESLDSTELVVTDDRYGAAAPLMDLTTPRTRARLQPMLQQGTVPVIAGFIGATQKGVPTTLGRGGTDYSASIVAAALDATDVFNYTDVNGVLTTDPRIASDARTIDVLTATEMSEMAYYGASVLHPMTIAPLIERNIPLRVKNTFNPEHPGTLIVHSDTSQTRFGLKAVTTIPEVSVISVTGRGMKGVPGIAGRTFSAVARTGTSVLMFSQASAETNICLVVPRASTERVTRELSFEFTGELARREIDEVGVYKEASIITVVGQGIADTPGVSGRVFGALGNANINLLAIAQGSSECSISMVVSDADCANGVRAVHTLAIGA
jgi:bifunctional aspartokinase / homoserine dehydrogenase 1